MGCSLNHGAVTGRGIGFPYNRSSVFRARAGAVVAGKVYMLAESLIDDAPEVTLPNDQSDAGSLANTVPIPASGAHDGASGFPTFVLALESAGDDGLFRGLVEGYYVDAEAVLSAGAKEERLHLYANATEQLTDSKPANSPRAPIIGRLMQEHPGTATATVKVHFNGTPGGFGVAGSDT